MRRPVGLAELVPDLEVGPGHLMAVVGLRGEEVRVVDLHLVARLELRRHAGVRDAEHHDVARRCAPAAVACPVAAPLCTIRSPPRKSTGGGALASRNATTRWRCLALGHLEGGVDAAPVRLLDASVLML